MGPDRLPAYHASLSLKTDMNIYLRPPEPVFMSWKWIAFGPLFLLALNYAASQLEDIHVMGLAFGLGFVLMACIFSIKKISLGLRLLSGLGLSLLISTIASAYLYTLCWTYPVGGLCESGHMKAYIFSNYLLSNSMIIFWIVIEIFLAIGKNLAYMLRYIKR